MGIISGKEKNIKTKPLICFTSTSNDRVVVRAAKGRKRVIEVPPFSLLDFIGGPNDSYLPVANCIINHYFRRHYTHLRTHDLHPTFTIYTAYTTLSWKQITVYASRSCTMERKILVTGKGDCKTKSPTGCSIISIK